MQGGHDLTILRATCSYSSKLAASSEARLFRRRVPTVTTLSYSRNTCVRMCLWMGGWELDVTMASRRVASSDKARNAFNNTKFIEI